MCVSNFSATVVFVFIFFQINHEILKLESLSCCIQQLPNHDLTATWCILYHMRGKMPYEEFPNGPVAFIVLTLAVTWFSPRTIPAPRWKTWRNLVWTRSPSMCCCVMRMPTSTKISLGPWSNWRLIMTRS